MFIIKVQDESRNSEKSKGRVTKVDLERLDAHLKQYMKLLRVRVAESYPPVLRKVA